MSILSQTIRHLHCANDAQKSLPPNASGAKLTQHPTRCRSDYTGVSHNVPYLMYMRMHGILILVSCVQIHTALGPLCRPGGRPAHDMNPLSCPLAGARHQFVFSPCLHLAWFRSFCVLLAGESGHLLHHQGCVRTHPGAQNCHPSVGESTVMCMVVMSTDVLLAWCFW